MRTMFYGHAKVLCMRGPWQQATIWPEAINKYEQLQPKSYPWVNQRTGPCTSLASCHLGRLAAGR